MLKTFSTPKILCFGMLFLLLSVRIISAGSAEIDDFFDDSKSFRNIKSVETEDLKSGEIREMTLKGGDKQSFSVSANAGSCLRFIVQQQGIDVVINVIENGKPVKKIDRSNGAYGRETVTFFPQQTSVLTIEIASFESNAVTGKYQISYTETNSPTENDRKRDLAENLMSDGEILSDESSENDKKTALEKFSDALKIWRDLGDEYEQAVVYYGIAYTYRDLSNVYEAAFFFNRSFKLFSKLNDEPGKAIN